MASKPDYFAPWVWLAATALSALCWWFGSGVHPQWWLTWLAPLPVLWLAPRVRAHGAALAAFVAYSAGACSLWPYLHTYIGLPLAVEVYAIGLPGVMLLLCVLLFRRLLLRGHALAAALAVPATWVAIEYVNNLLSPHATFFNIGYTQMDALAVIQIAAVTGIWGVGFLTCALPISSGEGVFCCCSCPPPSRCRPHRKHRGVAGSSWLRSRHWCLSPRLRMAAGGFRRRRRQRCASA